jgi:hypothetical protein
LWTSSDGSALTRRAETIIQGGWSVKWELFLKIGLEKKGDEGNEWNERTTPRRIEGIKKV